METTCSRCHQPVQPDNTFCPTCGMPQLVYSAEAIPGQIPAERWNEPVRDASIVDWKRGMRAALIMAVPAGILCSLFSPVSIFGLIWMSVAAALASAEAAGYRVDPQTASKTAASKPSAATSSAKPAKRPAPAPGKKPRKKRNPKPRK